MNIENNSGVAQASKLLDEMSWKTIKAFEALGEERDEAWVVVVRALHSEATIGDLKAAWCKSLDMVPDDGLLSLTVTMYALLGPSWHLICVNRYLLQVNDDCRDDTREECPLFGDTIEEVQTHWWERICNELDERLAEEEAAAERYRARKAKKAA